MHCSGIGIVVSFRPVSDFRRQRTAVLTAVQTSDGLSSCVSLIVVNSCEQRLITAEVVCDVSVVTSLRLRRLLNCPMRRLQSRGCTSLKACPHLFPKQETLYPETGDLLPKTATKSPVSGYKVSCFGNQCGQALMHTQQTCQVDLRNKLAFRACALSPSFTSFFRRMENGAIRPTCAG